MVYQGVYAGFLEPGTRKRTPKILQVSQLVDDSPKPWHRAAMAPSRHGTDGGGARNQGLVRRSYQW